MTTPNKPAGPKFLMPRDVDAVGPQNDAERRLYELIMDGIDSGPSQETSVAEFAGELRARIRAKTKTP